MTRNGPQRARACAAGSLIAWLIIRGEIHGDISNDIVFRWRAKNNSAERAPRKTLNLVTRERTTDRNRERRTTNDERSARETERSNKNFSSADHRERSIRIRYGNLFSVAHRGEKKKGQKKSVNGRYCETQNEEHGKTSAYAQASERTAKYAGRDVRRLKAGLLLPAS